MPKTALNGIFVAFYLTEKTNCIKELCQKSFKNILNYYVEFRIHAGKDHLSFCKNSANQTFSFITSNAVYFKKCLACQVWHPLETKFPLLLNTFLIATRQLSLTLFRMGFFVAAHGWGGGSKKAPSLPKICHRYPAMMKLGTVIPYLEKIQKIYESCDTPLEFC